MIVGRTDLKKFSSHKKKNLIFHLVFIFNMIFFLSSCTNNAERIKKTTTEMEFVKIPGKDYWMGKYEVIQAEWESVMGYNPSYDQGKRYPANRVEPVEIIKFIDRLNRYSQKKYRLPTDFEWWHACMGGRNFEFGTHDGRISTNRANYNGRAIDKGYPKGINRGKPTPVGHFRPNPFGLYDMSGNISEYVETEVDSRFYQHVRNKMVSKNTTTKDGKSYDRRVNDMVSRFTITKNGRKYFYQSLGGSWVYRPTYVRCKIIYKNSPFVPEETADEPSFSRGFRLIREDR